MKKLLFSAAIALSCLAGAAQPTSLNGLPILPDGYLTKMNPGGTLFVGSAPDGSAISFDRTTSKAEYYSQYSFGSGNSVAENGLIVGCDMQDSGIAVIMHAGNVTVVDPLADNYILSDLHGITPDGTRACGLAGNGFSFDEGHYMYRPLYIDIYADGSFSEPVFLPFPEKDFFGSKPQYCSAVWISADGKTILGQVVESTGMFGRYPIVYHQEENGEWSYTLPSAPLFNYANLPLPEDPGSFEQAFPDVIFPEYTDFMTPEQAEEFLEAVEYWQETGMEEENDPYAHLWLFMDPEQIEAFNEAVDIYNEAAIEYNEMLYNYYERLWTIVDSSVFFLHNAMTLSADGKKMAMAASFDVLNEDGEYTQIYVPWLFDLETGEYEEIGLANVSLIPNQILPDGTVVAAGPASDLDPAKSYFYLPGATEFIPCQDYISNLSPYYGDLINSNLTKNVITGIDPEGNYTYSRMTVTGCMAVSDDWSTIISAVDGYTLGYDMYFTYVLSDIETGVKEIVTPSQSEESYIVYNLQGLKVLETTDAESVKSLNPGIYIVNGKKTVIR